VATNPTIVMTTAVSGTSARPNKPSISPSLARSIMSAITMPTATHLRPDITLAIRMDHDNREALDFYVAQIEPGLAKPFRVLRSEMEERVVSPGLGRAFVEAPVDKRRSATGLA
jgi:hypothetical protein